MRAALLHAVAPDLREHHDRVVVEAVERECHRHPVPLGDVRRKRRVRCPGRDQPASVVVVRAGFDHHPGELLHRVHSVAASRLFQVHRELTEPICTSTCEHPRQQQPVSSGGCVLQPPAATTARPAIVRPASAVAPHQFRC